jgi:hypothetical protein
MRSGRCWLAWFRSRRAFAAARWRNPVTVRGRRHRDVDGDREPGRRRPRARSAGDGFDGGVQNAADADPGAHGAGQRAWLGALGPCRRGDRGSRHRPGCSDTGSPAGKQPGGDQLRGADATGLAGRSSSSHAEASSAEASSPVPAGLWARCCVLVVRGRCRCGDCGWPLRSSRDRQMPRHGLQICGLGRRAPCPALA